MHEYMMNIHSLNIRYITVYIYMFDNDHRLHIHHDIHQIVDISYMQYDHTVYIFVFRHFDVNLPMIEMVIVDMKDIEYDDMMQKYTVVPLSVMNTIGIDQ